MKLYNRNRQFEYLKDPSDPLEIDMKTADPVLDDIKTLVDFDNTVNNDFIDIRIPI